MANDIYLGDYAAGIYLRDKALLARRSLVPAASCIGEGSCWDKSGIEDSFNEAIMLLDKIAMRINNGLIALGRQENFEREEVALPHTERVRNAGDGAAVAMPRERRPCGGQD